MKLLLDTCIWGLAVDELRAAGHDVEWAGHWQTDPGDLQILRTAHGEQRILVTLDKDFGELAIVQGEPHSGIIRIADCSARRQASVILHVLTLYGAELVSAALVTADAGRVRIRPPDPPAEDSE